MLRVYVKFNELFFGDSGLSTMDKITYMLMLWFIMFIIGEKF